MTEKKKPSAPRVDSTLLPDTVMEPDVDDIDPDAEWEVVKVGGVLYRTGHSEKCRICNAPSEIRKEIEKESIMQRTWESIARSFSVVLGDPPLTTHQVRRHCERHVQSQAIISRSEIERHSRELGDAAQTGAVTIVNAYSAVQEVVRLGFEKMMLNPESVEISHFLSAIKIINDMERSSTVVASTESQTRLLVLILQHVQDIMSQDQFALFSSRLKSDPLYLSIAAQLRG